MRTLVLIAAVIIFASCGTSDKDEGAAAPGGATTTAEVTRESYIARVDAFCRKSNAEAKGINQQALDAVAGLEDADEQMAVLEPILKEGYEFQQRLDDELKAIPRPPADREILERLLTARDQQTALLGRLADAADSRDAARFAALAAEQRRAGERSRALAQGYGFTECAGGKNEAE